MTAPAMNRLKIVVGLVCLAIAAFAVTFAYGWWMQREWRGLQRQQLGAILRLEKFPPAGESKVSWRDEISILYSVWELGTVSPSKSGLRNADMRALHARLAQIVKETTPENSIDSVDRVYGLLVERNKRAPSLSFFREEFRSVYKISDRLPVVDQSPSPAPSLDH